MKIRDCYPGDVVMIKDQKWRLYHYVPELESHNAVQVSRLDFDPQSNEPPVLIASLEEEVQDVVKRGFDSEDHLNLLSYFEIILTTGCWAPLLERRIGNPTYQLNEDEKRLVSQIYDRFEEAGLGILVASKKAAL